MTKLVSNVQIIDGTKQQLKMSAPKQRWQILLKASSSTYNSNPLDHHKSKVTLKRTSENIWIHN